MLNGPASPIQLEKIRRRRPYHHIHHYENGVLMKERGGSGSSLGTILLCHGGKEKNSGE